MEYESHYYEMADRENKYGRFPGNVIAPFLKEHVLPGMRLLEVGCGTAGIIRELSAGVEYAGLEISEYAVEEAKKDWAGNPHASFVVGVSEKLPFDDKSFDCVLMFYTLEHFKQPKTALLEALRVLKDKGRLVIVAPNHELPSVPPTLRFKSTAYRFGFFLNRIVDYVQRIFGKDSFRVLSDNITNAKGIYEKKDDDLWHAVSTWEVAHYLKNHNVQLERFWEEKPLGERRKGTLIGLVRKLPAFAYVGVPMVASFIKR